MAKRIHHMGMTMSKTAHDRFHDRAPLLNPEQHDALMKRMGITREQDVEWHRTHLTLGELRALSSKGLKPIDPMKVGSGFLAWCGKQGWIIEEKTHYFATKEGSAELRTRFGIKV